VFDSTTDMPRIERPEHVKELGREEDLNSMRGEPTPEALAIAEQVLLEVISNCQTAAEAIPKLEPYYVWLNAHPLVAEDLVKREPAFIKWLMDNKPKAPENTNSKTLPGHSHIPGN
jgi:hypothetical protein